MDIKFPLLTADQIEVKVKQVSKNGAVLLLYKTARTDMDMLDTVIGPMNWAVEYQEIKGNLYCGIGIADADHERHWVWKWDCGTESRADGEGNEKKGEASDAFKRAGFKWGIGRELYTCPFTFAKVPVVEDTRKPGSYKLANPFQRFEVSEIEYTNGRVSSLRIKDDKGITIYSYSDTAKHDPKKETNIPLQLTGGAVFIPATDAQKKTIRMKLEHKEPIKWASMQNTYGNDLEKLSRERAGEALAKLQEAGA